MNTEPSSSPAVLIRNLDFEWEKNRPLLSIKKFTIGQGEKLFLQGPSGSGKSTLLNLVAGIFTPTKGEIFAFNAPFHKLKPSERDILRAEIMGVVFQQFNLVPFLGLVENVLLPCDFSPKRAARVGGSKSERVDAAKELLCRLGLSEEVEKGRSASQLSVGQQQRVAAARALIGNPSLIIADEPTSALDHDTKDNFISTLLQEASNAAVLFVSHDASLATHFDNHLHIADLQGGQK